MRLENLEKTEDAYGSFGTEMGFGEQYEDPEHQRIMQELRLSRRTKGEEEQTFTIAEEISRLYRKLIGEMGLFGEQYEDNSPTRVVESDVGLRASNVSDTFLARRKRMKEWIKKSKEVRIKVGPSTPSIPPRSD